MTNPLIPYSFIPGSKAKAQEVNANFISVAEGIDTNKQFTVTEIEAINNKIENDLKTTLAQKELGNSGKVTNIILEAPSGVAEYEGSNIIVKKDLKVLIPNGRNSDGTFKNTEYILEADKILDFTNVPNGSYYFALKTDGTSVYRLYKDIIESETQPSGMTENLTWYDTKNNYWYNYTHSITSWTKIEMTPFLGSFNIKQGQISNFSAFKPCKILDNSRKKEIISWLTPDYSRLIQLTSREVWDGYKAPLNGFFLLGGIYPDTSAGCSLCFINNIMVAASSRYTNYGSSGHLNMYIPVSPGDVFKVTNISLFEQPQFIPAKGAY